MGPPDARYRNWLGGDTTRPDQSPRYLDAWSEKSVLDVAPHGAVEVCPVVRMVVRSLARRYSRRPDAAVAVDGAEERHW